MQEAGRQERLEAIPMDYFVGVGRKDTGILQIVFSNSFLAQLTDYARRYLPSVDHYYTHLKHYEPPRLETAGAAYIEVSSHMFELTDYTYEELLDRKTALRKRYKGKKEAPFDVELY